MRDRIAKATMDNAQAGRDLSAAAGKAARRRVPLESHRDFEPARGETR